MEREFIIITINRNVKRKVFIDEILYCKAENTYTFIKLLNGISYLISKPIKEVQAELSKYYFFRISRSYLVNMHYAHEINKNGSPTIKLIETSVLRVSRSRLKLLEEIVFKKPKFNLHNEKGISHNEKLNSQS
ncbi:MAG: LytTR family DNA-binding domain-containing protein [Thiomicrorhabdus sp.]|jgi:DNA-binding LytR/AlgR family response regulator|nr:LytTR family DNA-binding domain-containing protein [Thiomicrorhabdus sp.]